MAENVKDYLVNQVSGEAARKTVEALFENWTKPELAGGKNTLLGPLVLEGGFGYEKTDARTTLESLSSQNSVLHATLITMLQQAPADYHVPSNRRPYKHQEEAFRAAAKGESIIVSAGTGSGKTECFLYPIISDILRENDNERMRPGIRAIILYPTNALMHSQEERLAAWLNTQSNLSCTRPISFCLYNSMLEEGEKTNNPSNQYQVKSRRSLRSIAPNEIAAGTFMPDILLINCSMLEYMLLRRSDLPIFRSPDIS